MSGRKTLTLRHAINTFKSELVMWQASKATPEKFNTAREVLHECARRIAEGVRVTLSPAERTALTEYMDGGSTYPFQD